MRQPNWECLPENWRVVNLIEIADIVMGQSPISESYNSQGKGLPFFQGKSEFGEKYPTVVKWCDQPSKIAEVNDVLFSVRAPVGAVNIANTICCIGRGLAAIRCKSEYVLIEYLYSFLKFAESYLSLVGQGSTFAAISGKELQKILITLPPLEEQQYIVEILQQADELRRLRQDSLAKAEKLASALFLEMFGDPEKNPYQWPVQPFGSFITASKYGPRFPNANYSEVGVHILRTTDMNRDGSIRWWESPKIDLNEVEIDKNALKPKTLVFSRSGTIGPVALYMGSDTPCVSGAYLIEIELNDDIHPEFAVQYFLSDYGQYHLINGAKGATQKNLNVPTLRSIPVFFPEKDKQLEFVKKLQDIKSSITEVIGSKVSIEKLLVTITSQVFTGKLTEVWREQHSGMKSVNVGMKTAIPILGAAAITVKSEATFSVLFESRKWLWGQLSQFQKAVLQQVYRSQGYLTGEGLGDLIDALPEDINHDQEQKIRKTLEQLVALGLIVKVSLKDKENGFVTAYRALREGDDGKARDIGMLEVW